MKVLEGIKVLELGRVPPAELPGMMLADMGADVLKIDTPAAAGQSDAARSEAFSHTNRNKRSMALNLKAPEGHAIFLELAENADIVIEGFRPGVMKRLGADYESLRQRNPRLIFCSLSGFGQTGLYRDRPAHDLNFLALSGALSLWGAGSQAPDIPLNLVADYGGASMHGALAILMALFARERSGAGQYLDISYFESTYVRYSAPGICRRQAKVSSAEATRITPCIQPGTNSFYPWHVRNRICGATSARRSTAPHWPPIRASQSIICAAPMQRNRLPGARSATSFWVATAATGKGTSRSSTFASHR